VRQVGYLLELYRDARSSEHDVYSLWHLQNSNASDWLCVFLLMVSYRVYTVRKSEKKN